MVTKLIFTIERVIEKKILPFFCYLLSFLKKKKPLLQDNKTIVILRFWGLGESILTLPMIKALKEARPNSKITVLCTKRNEGVFYSQSFVDSYNVISSLSIPFLILTNFKKYDLVIDSEPHFAISAIIAFFLGKRSIGFDYGTRSKLYDINVHYNDKQHVVYTFCDLLSPLGIITKPNGLVRLKYDENAKNAISFQFEANSIKLGKKLLIGMHAFCGPTAPWRAWPKERFAELIDRIKQKYDCMVILTGSGAEAVGNKEIISMLKNHQEVYAFSNLSPTTLFYLIEKYDLMVSNDTGPMHVAAAQGVPTIGFFGPETPVRFGPFPPDRNVALYHKVHDPPLINVHLNKVGKCDGECLRRITVDEAFETVNRFMQQKRRG